MSIYATLWSLKFPESGDDYFGCNWITVIAQGVPQHIGVVGEEYGYDADPYGEFLPPPVNPEGEVLRAVVFVTEFTSKGTDRCGQEYIDPLLVLSGEEYCAISFESLHNRLRTILRGSLARVTMQIFDATGSYVIREDGSKRVTGSSD